MKTVVVGLGVQGQKRLAVAADQAVATVDPVVSSADFQSIQEVPLATYDAACVCVPDQEKLPILRYLLGHQKHVLVEKPLLVERAGIEELIQLSRANRVTCYTAYNHRFEPHIVGLKRILAENSLGQIYLVRFFYGNGTARDVRNSPWRDQGLGVCSDLGSHMLDLTLFLFGPLDGPGEVWRLDRFENQAPDHVLFGFHGHPVVEMEAMMISWRNTFGLDVYGELGSAHVQCLCKWGPSTLTVRKRIFPSGRPLEMITPLEQAEQADPTWKCEHEYFLELCHTGASNLENDLWIQEKISQLAQTMNRF